jgi:hypothetical protein
MTVALAELGLGLQADWLSLTSESYRPPSWPPSKDWVVSEDSRGRVLSRWGDPIWDFTPFAGKVLTMNFGDGGTGRSARIDSANADLLRLVMTWLMWGPRPVKSANTLRRNFELMRPVFALCSREGIVASSLMRFPRVLDQLPEVLPPSSYSATVFLLHKLLDVQDKLGFALVDAFGLKRLAAIAPEHETVQTAYIPPRIWMYQVSRLKACLDDYVLHRQAISDCFSFCLEAYAANYGSLEKALSAKPSSSRIPFQTRKPTEDGRVFHGPFPLTAERFGIAPLLQRWVNVPDGGLELRQLSSYMTLVQWAGLAYIANFTLQRIDEAASLRADCLQFEEDEKLGRVPIICGETTKTVQDADARWPTSPSVETAVEAMAHIARLRVQCAVADPRNAVPPEVAANPPLFMRSFEPWVPRMSAGGELWSRRATAYQPLNEQRWGKLFDAAELTIREADLQVAHRLTPNLSEGEFAVGKVWPLAWHQLRRTGAVNMFASGLLSDSSMQYLMKHASRLMPLYYGRGYTQLHLNEEVAGLVTATMYEVMAKSMLTAMGDRFVSPRSEDQKQVIVVNLIGTKDAKELASAARRGDVSFRETRLGACTSRTLCTYGGIESVARCAGGDGAKPCVDVLYDRTKLPSVQQDLARVSEALARLPEGSPRHTALLQERQALENYINVINEN